MISLREALAHFYSAQHDLPELPNAPAEQQSVALIHSDSDGTWISLSAVVPTRSNFLVYFQDLNDGDALHN